MRIYSQHELDYSVCSLKRGDIVVGGNESMCHVYISLVDLDKNTGGVRHIVMTVSSNNKTEVNIGNCSVSCFLCGNWTNRSLELHQDKINIALEYIKEHTLEYLEFTLGLENIK